MSQLDGGENSPAVGFMWSFFDCNVGMFTSLDKVVRTIERFRQNRMRTRMVRIYREAFPCQLFRLLEVAPQKAVSRELQQSGQCLIDPSRIAAVHLGSHRVKPVRLAHRRSRYCMMSSYCP